MRQFATSWRLRFAIKTRLFDNFHIGVSLEIVITTYLQQSHDTRTNHWRISARVRVHVARYLRDTRTKLARWNCDNLSHTSVVCYPGFRALRTVLQDLKTLVSDFPTKNNKVIDVFLPLLPVLLGRFNDS